MDSTLNSDATARGRITHAPDESRAGDGGRRYVPVVGLGIGVVAVLYAGSVDPTMSVNARWYVGTVVMGMLLGGLVLAVRVTYRAGRRSLAPQLAAAHALLARIDDDRRRLAGVLSAAGGAIVTILPDGRIADWDSAAEELYGYSRSEAVGRPFAFLESVGSSSGPAMLDTIENGGRHSVEAVHVRKCGTIAQIALTMTRIDGPAGTDCGVVAIARDITEYKREAAFHQESKLESLGRLSAGLAHEINSPIQFVGDNARFLEDAYQEMIRVVHVYRGLLDTSNPIGWMERQERVREAEAGIDFDYLQEEIPSAVAQTLEGIDRVSTIVRAMKTFSHPGHAEQVPADINEALSATATVTRHQVNDVADLNLELSDLPPVRCNIADLNQVFLNLIVNAADAIEETGRRGVITVTTAVEGADAVVRIADTGGGIPDDVRPKIFDPFFTTKDVGRGSGQGLPLARGVVQDGHGGSLTLDTVAGQGTTFTVRVPIEGLAVEPAEADGGHRLLATA